MDRSTIILHLFVSRWFLLVPSSNFGAKPFDQTTMQFSLAELEGLVQKLKDENKAFVSLEELQTWKNTFRGKGGGEKIGPFTTVPSTTSKESAFTNTVPTVTTVPTFRFDAGVGFNTNTKNNRKKTGHASSVKTVDYFSVTGGETSSIGNGTTLFGGQNQNFNPNNIHGTTSTAFGNNTTGGGGWFWGGTGATNNETSKDTTNLHTNHTTNGVNHFADAAHVMSRTPVAADSNRPAMDGANFTNGSDLHGSGLHSEE